MRSSITARVSRAGFGLLAIWCLGCSSFDVMIDALVRGGPGRAGCLMAGETEAPDTSDAGAAVRSPSADDSPNACGCGPCVAVRCDATAIAVAPHATPETAQHTLGSALSVDREPLVPPPIAFVAI